MKQQNVGAVHQYSYGTVKNGDKKEQRGITLIILVITIVIILLLAGTSINLLLGNNFLKDSKAISDNAKIKEIQDELVLDKLLAIHEKALKNEEDSSNLTMQEYLDFLQRKGFDLNKLEDTNNENKKKLELEGHIFELEEKDGDIIITYYGESDNEEDEFKVEITNVTIDSISIKVVPKTIKITEYRYYIKEVKTGKEYTLVGTSSEPEYTYKNLTQSTEYAIKVGVTDSNNVKYEKAKKVTTDSFYFEAKISNPNITVQKKMNDTLLVKPTFDLVVHNNSGNKYNSYDVEYTVSIIGDSNIHFDNEPNQTIAGGSKREEKVSISFDIEDLDNIPETVTIRLTTTKPYSKSFDFEFNLKEVWVIQKIEDLVNFSNNVNKGRNYSNEDVILLNDLDFADPSDYENPNRTDYNDYNGDNSPETLIEELQKGRGFIPIGFVDETKVADQNVHFGGNFDGQKHTISNLYINNNVETHTTGFFGYIEKASISNFTLEGKVTSSAFASIAGVISFAKDSDIDNVTNKADVSIEIGRYQTAGVIAQADGVNISNCKNYGNISNGNHTGGIAAIVGNGIDRKETTITNSFNYGTISNSLGSTATGGIVGHQVNKDVGLLTIEGCENHGTISVNRNNQKEQKVGGIIGIVRSKAIITNCLNEGKVEGHLSNQTFSFNGGGIVGRVEAGHAIIRNCHNSGEIAGEYRLGGIVGHINNGGTIYVIDCHNEGVLRQVLINQNSSSASGGILGYGNNVHVYLINSYNSGAINGHQAGGLIGAFSTEATDSAYVVNSYNAGEVTSTTNYAGGIFGHLNAAAIFKVLNVYNIGIVSGRSEEYTYGIGYINTTDNHTVTNVYYNEKHSPSNQSYGWTSMDDATMHSTSFVETLNNNIPNVDITEMKNKLISVGLIDKDYDIHVHHWEFNDQLKYPTIKNEH